jgi:parallel beta-helix repeat protein
MKINHTNKTFIFFSILFFLSLFIISFNTVSAEEPEVWVDDDFDDGTSGWNVTHFNDIQSGMKNLENNGTLYVYNGNYFGDVLVNKTCTITGENIDSVFFSGQFMVSSNNSIIEQLTLKDFIGEGYDFPSAILDMSSNSIYRDLRLVNNTYGIEFYDSSFGAIIDNNIFEDNSNGVYSLNQDLHTIVTNNTFTNNVENALYIINSENITIANNYILNTAETGLTLIDSNNNLIYNNFFENSFNLYVEGGTNNSFNITKTPGENIIGGSYLGGNYWSDYIGVDFNGDGLGNTSYPISLGLNDNHPLVFTYFYVDDDADSTWYDTNHVHTISEAVDNSSSTGAIISVFNGTYNEYVYVSKTVSIIGESIEGVYVTNDEDDHTFYITSPGVLLSHMTIADNHGVEGSSAGIYDYTSNAIYNNLHITNNDYGIYLSSTSAFTIIKNCTIENNSDAGIYLLYSYNTLVFNNYIINNTLGIMHLDATQDIIYNNYFDNVQNVNITIEESIYNTSWNIVKIPGENIIGGPNIGGNYWNDYFGMDIDADGIGDESYVVYSDAFGTYFDFYPLTNNLNEPPMIGIPDPVDGTNDLTLEVDWSIPITDDEGWFSWNISCSNGQSNESSEDENGTKNLHLSDLSYGTTYTIHVKVYDWTLWTNQTFTFTTKNKPQEEKKEPINRPPIARPGGPYTSFPNGQIVMDGSSSSDPDGYITSYTWTFGDGSSATGETCTHSYSDEGTYTITLTVTDNKGKTGSSTTTSVIVKPNNPPQIQSSVNHNPNELTVQLSLTVTDADNDDISCSINWDDSTSTSLSLTNGESTTQSHTYTAYGLYSIRITANDGSTDTSKTHTFSLFTEGNEENETFTGFYGFSTTSENESFIENQIDERSIFGESIDKKYVIPVATGASIILLFLLNLLVEFLSDYSSEHALDFRKDKKTKKVKKQRTIQPHKYLNKKELLSVLVATLLLSFVLSWTWAPDLSMFLGLFIITLIIVAVMFIVRESIRSYLCHKQNLSSEFYIWPLGGIMMLVSTFLGNTFSLAANHQYDEQGDIKKFGRINFIVALFMYVIVAFAFIANLFYPSIILQMIVIVTILNLFIDLFPFRPMDGYETRQWNLPLWIGLYIIVFISYVVVYFNLYP